ncbi:non-reducing end alpha-L-arabinofuranosidase family hydrolase [Plantactinospora sp. DSM 117369]
MRLRTRLATVTVAGLAVAGTAVAISGQASAATGCQVNYSVSSQWQSGFGANVTITNLGDPINGWTLTWSYSAGQQITQAWNATVTQSGGQVVARNMSYNAAIATNAGVAFGFNGSWSGSNPAPTSFTLNGTVCTGGVNSTTGPPTSSPPTSAPPTSAPPTSPPPSGSLPNSFRWRSTGPLIAPKSDASHNILAVKDPSVVYHNGRYHVFASTANSNGNYSMVYMNFTDWSQAGSAQHHYLDQTPVGGGYKAAPHVFFFAPQNRWYLVFQTGDNAAYSTTSDISNPQSWTAPQRFYPGGMPQIIRDNIGNGYWVDMWVICDTAKCYLFSDDDNGHLYRSETTVGQFPNGMTNTVIAMQDTRNRLFEAPNIYKIVGSDTYLMIHEAIGSDGKRWFRSWTAPAITGPWTGLADTEANPFARANNVTFDGTAWTRDISHGEAIRAGNDQTQPLSPCNIRYLYQGLDPNAGGDYNRLPWRLGLLTQTNSTC